jgi:hypothetical protein
MSNYAVAPIGPTVQRLDPLFSYWRRLAPKAAPVNEPPARPPVKVPVDPTRGTRVDILV